MTGLSQAAGNVILESNAYQTLITGCRDFTFPLKTYIKTTDTAGKQSYMSNSVKPFADDAWLDFIDFKEIQVMHGLQKAWECV